MSPLISVIVAAYNASATIGETIESVLSQTCTDLELIIVDDGSTDNTKGITLGYARKDSRVQYVWQENAGSPAARNTALKVAKGKYISIIDADDLWHQEKLSRQIALINGADDTFVLTGNHIFYDKNGERIWGPVRFPPATVNNQYSVVDILLVGGFYMFLINTALVSKDLVKKLGGWDPGKWTAEDWDLWIRAAMSCKFLIIEEPLVYYRKHSGSVTSAQNVVQVLDAHEMIIRRQYQNHAITSSELAKVLVSHQMETCGLLLYQGELFDAVKVLFRSLCYFQGWITRDVWMRATEIFSLSIRKLRSVK